MTANAGYHAYATGDVLTASQVQYNLQNQTVMYFATTTARDTALATAKVDGMCAYTPATGVMVYNGTAWVAVGGASPLTTKGDIWGYSTTNARVPVGTNGQVLLADSTNANGVSWGTPSAGSLTLLSTTTLSGSSTAITGISQSYTNLLVYIYGVNSASQHRFYCWPNGLTGATYYTQIYTWYSSVNGDGGTYLPLVYNGTNAASGNTNNEFQLQIANYANSATVKPFSSNGIYYDSNNSAYGGIGAFGGINTTSAITSLTFATTASFTGGTVKIYGVN